MKITDIKTVRVKSDVFPIMLQYKGNTLVNLSGPKKQPNGKTVYKNDTWSNTFDSIEAAKEFVMEKLKSGYYGKALMEEAPKRFSELCESYGVVNTKAKESKDQEYKDNHARAIKESRILLKKIAAKIDKLEKDPESWKFGDTAWMRNKLKEAAGLEEGDVVTENAMIKTSAKVFPSKEAAEKTADKLRSGDADWKYETAENAGGGWVIKIYDEEGEFVSDFTGQ